MFQLADKYSTDRFLLLFNLQELNTAKMRAYPIKVQKILKSTRDDMTGRAFFLQI